MNFDWFNPVRLITGRGCVKANSGLLAGLGKKCMIVTGGASARRCGALRDMEEALAAHGIDRILFDRVRQNPLLTVAKEAGDLARSEGCAFLVAIGGGSPLDSAKASAVFAANDMPAMALYEGGWRHPALPVVAVGTTAGTGSEVGPVAVLTMPDGHKKSVSHMQLYPVLALGDASYTATLPYAFTVSTALDALSHALEGYCSTAANAVSDLFAEEAVALLFQALGALPAEGAEIPPETRETLYRASVLAGYTLARCGTCYCHTLGYHLTERYGVAHGTACAVFLPGFLRRARALLPGRCGKLEKRIGGTVEELAGLVEGMHGCPAIAMEADEIARLAARGAASANFARTAPEGFGEPEAVAALTELFGAGRG